MEYQPAPYQPPPYSGPPPPYAQPQYPGPYPPQYPPQYAQPQSGLPIGVWVFIISIALILVLLVVAFIRAMGGVPSSPQELRARIEDIRKNPSKLNPLDDPIVAVEVTDSQGNVTVEQSDEAAQANAAAAAAQADADKAQQAALDDAKALEAKAQADADAAIAKANADAAAATSAGLAAASSDSSSTSTSKTYMMKNDGIPSVCPTGKTLKAGLCYATAPCETGKNLENNLCYKPCPTGYKGVGPVCWQTCPSGFTDTGVSCLKPKPYGRGAGYPWKFGDKAFDYSAAGRRCTAANPQGCIKSGLIWYPKCKSGYHAVGCCICSPDCPAGMTDAGITCTKKSQTRGAGTVNQTIIGTIPTACKTGSVKVGALCYKPCDTGFVASGLLCKPAEHMTVMRLWNRKSGIAEHFVVPKNAKAIYGITKSGKRVLLK